MEENVKMLWFFSAKKGFLTLAYLMAVYYNYPCENQTVLRINREMIKKLERIRIKLYLIVFKRMLWRIL